MSEYIPAWTASLFIFSSDLLPIAEKSNIDWSFLQHGQQNRCLRIFSSTTVISFFLLFGSKSDTGWSKYVIILQPARHILVLRAFVDFVGVVSAIFRFHVQRCQHFACLLPVKKQPIRFVLEMNNTELRFLVLATRNAGSFQTSWWTPVDGRVEKSLALKKTWKRT